MNRRKAIYRITIAGLGIAVGGTAYKWWTLARRPDLDYVRQHTQLIAALCETIIPASDTPGANDAKVQDFILKMIRDCTPRKDQNNFISGLESIQSHCRRAYGREYEHCTPSEQAAALALYEDRGKPYKGVAGKIEARLLGRSFFAILKDYTIQGYCTSQVGATKGLAYAYIPGSFNPCIPLQKGQKAWATN